MAEEKQNSGYKLESSLASISRKWFTSVFPGLQALVLIKSQTATCPQNTAKVIYRYSRLLAMPA